MTDTLPASYFAEPKSPRFCRWCVTASLVVSSMGIIASVIAWWLVRLNNLDAVESGTRVHDLVIEEASESSLTLLLIIMLIVGGTALWLALIGAKGALGRPRLLVVTGMLATSLLMVPVVVLAQAIVVTHGVMIND